MYKQIILFDIDYTLINTDLIKKISHAKLLHLLGKEDEEVRLVLKSIINKSIHLYGRFNMPFYISSIAKRFDQQVTEKELVDVLIDTFPFQKTLYSDVEKTLLILSKKYKLGIQSEGDQQYQFRKIACISNLFNKNYCFVFGKKKLNIIRKLSKIKQKIIIIDDKPEYIAYLNKKGIRSILIDRNKNGLRNKNFKESIKRISDLISLLK